ncbi:class I adenylate-forming enzyme family protein [Gordonia terrae]|uniref:class I adenylate-forming enzyme family protein n=1 Tax=Gordonia terrae TaxID=2055 RepID=UPI003F6BFFA8
MSAYDERPWLASYPAGRPVERPIEFDSALAIFYAAVSAAPDGPAIYYFDATITWREVDRASDALASLLISRGFVPGDRLALCLQNNPAVVIGLVAAWKARGIAAFISPMSREHEFEVAVRDYAPTALLILGDVYDDVARRVLLPGDTAIRTVVTVSSLDFQLRNDARILSDVTRRAVGDTLDLVAVLSSFGGPTPKVHLPAPSDIAVLAPTSGTTGEPKGAMVTHRNLAFSAQGYRDWFGLAAGEPILAMAPIFHVTGLVGSVMLALLLRSPIVLTHRFDAGVILDAVREWQPRFAVAAITAYIALAEEPGITPEDLSSLRVRCSGGLPIPPATAERLEAALGGYIYNVYGQTESTSPSHMVPFGVRAPIDDETGVLSVGLPVFDTMVKVVDDKRQPVSPGVIGELVTSGPQIVAGYWRREAATSASFVDGALRTGDVGFMDSDGWFYVVDRSTDLINAAGYKVWPFEVEQVLASHPAVREVAVIGIPDDYRGQSTRAYVALRPGETATVVELIEYCRARMSAYKYPREIELVDALPRTATGKLMRRALRQH